MAKKSTTDQLFETLRAQGLRSRVARLASDAVSTGRGGAGKSTAAVRGVITDLRKAADELEERIKPGKSRARSDAAKKAARTRARKANQRSAAAKKAAATRKRTSSTSRTRAKAKR